MAATHAMSSPPLLPLPTRRSSRLFSTSIVLSGLLAFVLVLVSFRSTLSFGVRAGGLRTMRGGLAATRLVARRGGTMQANYHVSSAAMTPGATGASEDSPIEILETKTTATGSAQTFGFRITGNDKKPFIRMTLEAPADSELISVNVKFPGLGVILEQKYLDDGPRIVVDDKESTGTAIGALEVGDILRAFSAVYTVTPPTDVMAFYANPPKKVNVRGMYEVNGKNFAKTIAAIQSNGELIDRFGEKMEVSDISLVVERKKVAPAE